jgi:glycosyltransferase involved in cell wall biosynthesis
MNILVIHQYYLEDGDSGGTRFNEMIRIWNEKGHKVTVLAGMVHGYKTEKYEHLKGKYFHDLQKTENLRIIRSHVSELYNINFWGRLIAYFSFMFSSILAGSFKACEKYDIIIVTSPPLFLGISAYVLSKLKRIPYIFEVRDLWPESAIDLGIVKNKLIIKLSYWAESFIYKNAKKINVLTPAFKNHLIKYKEISEKKIFMIPNASDFSYTDELHKTFDVKAFKEKIGLKDYFTIIYVGAFGVANHLIQIIDAATQIKNKKVKFVLIGEGMQKKYLKDEVVKRQLDNLIFIDAMPKTEVMKYIMVADIGLSILKKSDTFKTIYSNKTFDYMSCKKPILMAIDGVSRELVEQAKCGSFVEPENTNELLIKVDEYFNNLPKLVIEGENGYNFAKINFDRNALALQYLNEIINVI